MKLVLEKSKVYYERNKEAYKEIYDRQAKNYRIVKNSGVYIIEALDYGVWNQRSIASTQDVAKQRMSLYVELVIFPEVKDL